METVFDLIITGRKATPEKLIQDLEVNGQRIRTTRTVVEQDIVTAFEGKCIVEFECDRSEEYDKILLSADGESLISANRTREMWIVKCKATIKIK